RGRKTHDVLQTEFPVPLDRIEREFSYSGRWQGELRHQARDGRTVIVDSRWAVDTDPQGVETVMEINTDVTERKRLDALKDEFVSLVSHELRTPLSSIRGYAEVLLAGDAGELTPTQRQFLEVIDRNG